MDVFQTTATTLVLVKEIIDFIDRYHTAYQDAKDILARVKESKWVLEKVELAVDGRTPLKDSHEAEVIGDIRRSVKSCHALLSKVKDVLEKNLDSRRFERTRLVFGRKSLVEMQNELANHLNVLSLSLSILSTLDAADIREILKTLKSQICSNEIRLADAGQHGLPAVDRDEQPDEVILEDSALARHVEDIRLDDGWAALAQTIEKAKVVQRSLQGEPGEIDELTPSGAHTPLDEVAKNPIGEADDRPEPHLESGSESIKHLSEDKLRTFIFQHRMSAKDEAQASEFNRAETSVRQAIIYAEELERRTGKRESGILQEELSSIYQKNRQWQESISLLTALLTRDTDSEPVERAWHNQLLGATYFSKDLDDCTKGAKSSDPVALKKATSYALKAYNFRKETRCNSPEELERQRLCIKLLVNTFNRLNLKVEADAFAKELPDTNGLRPEHSTTDHGGPDQAARAHETRLEKIAQAIDERKHSAIQGLGPYGSADIAHLTAEQTTILFFTVVRCSDKDSVECLLTHADVDGLAKSTDPERESKHLTALHVAARQSDEGHLHVIRSLLKHDAEIDAQDNDGCTPLIQAVDSNNFEAVKLLLLSHGANKEIVDNDDWSILHYAVRLDNVKMLKFLLKRAPQLIHFTDQVEDTPLHHAVRQERVDMVKVLCEACQDLEVNTSNTAGHYPLYLAAANPVTERRHQVFDALAGKGAKSKDNNPPPYLKDYQTLTKARRLSDVSVATTLTNGSDSGSPPRAGFLRRVITAGSARA